MCLSLLICVHRIQFIHSLAKSLHSQPQQSPLLAWTLFLKM